MDLTMMMPWCRRNGGVSSDERAGSLKWVCLNHSNVIWGGVSVSAHISGPERWR